MVFGSSGFTWRPFLRPCHQPRQATRQLSLKPVLLDVDHLTTCLQSLCEHGDLDNALHILSLLQTPPSTNAYLSLLKACQNAKALDHAKKLHAHIAHHGIALTGPLGDYLVLTLAKCGAIQYALGVLPRHSVFSWTAIISTHADCGCGQEALEMYQLMQMDGLEPNTYTFVSLFKACGSLPDLVQGHILHADASRKGFTTNVFVGNTLVSMYGKCGALMEAEAVFMSLLERDVVSWNAMLSAYTEQGLGKKALCVFRQMQEDGIGMSKQTIILTLQACGALVEEAADLEASLAKLRALEIGEALHSIARKRSYLSDEIVGTSLLHMYGNCGAVAEAEHMFDRLEHRDIVAWTALLSAYLERGERQKALWTYRQMHVDGLDPNELTFALVFQACRYGVEDRSPAKISLEVGKALHLDAQRKGYTSDFLVGNTIISMYGGFPGAIGEAEGMFKALLQRNTISWNAMLSAYADEGEVEKVLDLYKQMKNEGVSLTDLSFIAVLQVCPDVGSLHICAWIQFDIFSTGYGQSPSISTTVIHAYGTCGSMADAQAVLEELSIAGMVSWNACIEGYAREGSYQSSTSTLAILELVGHRPDDATMSSILSACSHAGLVGKGFEHFDMMIVKYGVLPDLKHFGIMVDLLGRAGNFKYVEKFLENMPAPADVTIWLSLLSACRLHGNLEVAKQVFSVAVCEQPEQASPAYVLLSNMYADVNMEALEAEVEWL